MILKAGIAEFLALALECPVLDVRSPGEYAHAHIPGAYSLPLFSDEERKVVGTAYKQQSREVAIKIGLDYFGVKMRHMVEEVEVVNSKFKIQNSKPPDGGSRVDNRILVHCWRGGMRSAGVAWLLDLYGFKVYTLQGGYKSYRNWVLQQFDADYPLHVIGGYTGAGKTEVLKKLAAKGHKTIDLEGIANHKGSAFGGLGAGAQPTQEMFENELAMALYNIASDGVQQPIWIEDESQRIGSVNLPGAFYDTLRTAQVHALSVPFEQRLEYLTKEYGKHKKEELINATVRIQKRLGGQNTKTAVNYLIEGDYKESFRILLHYYDKYYEKGLKERQGNAGQVKTVVCEDVDAVANYKKLVAE